MQKPLLLLFSFILIISLNVNAQREKCHTVPYWEQHLEIDPAAAERRAQLEFDIQQWMASNTDLRATPVVTIPVVVHIVYNTTEENISDEQVLSQMTVLNDDFRLLNADSLLPSNPFWYYSADVQFEFCLAKQDPNGNPTSGITRTYTETEAFTGNGDVKFDTNGGKDNWDPTKYLNLWVCNLSGDGGTLGYATFPSEMAANPELDGVVIEYRCFGTTGTAGTGGFENNNLGRTATHEVGHWMALYHIWGDENCGDDEVDDTPTHEEDNYGCPTFPHNANNSCGTDENGEMFMNYMDYVDDHCMVMFSFGQRDRMHAALNTARVGLLSSQGCESATAINTTNYHELAMDIYPNPNDGHFSLELHAKHADGYEIRIGNILGQTVYSFQNQSVNSEQIISVNLSHLDNGIYFVSVVMGNESAHKKIMIND